jgi:hypothetical protein
VAVTPDSRLSDFGRALANPVRVAAIRLAKERGEVSSVIVVANVADVGRAEAKNHLKFLTDVDVLEGTGRERHDGLAGPPSQRYVLTPHGGEALADVIRTFAPAAGGDAETRQPALSDEEVAKVGHAIRHPIRIAAMKDLTHTEGLSPGSWAASASVVGTLAAHHFLALADLGAFRLEEEATVRGKPQKVYRADGPLAGPVLEVLDFLDRRLAAEDGAASA